MALNKNPNREVIRTILKYILAWQLESDDNKIIIGLEGISGIGKTTIANEIAKKYKRICVVSLDHFLKSQKLREKKLLESKNKALVYRKQWYDVSKFKKLISDFRKNKKSYTLQSKAFRGKKYKTITYDLNKPIMLVEGIFLNDQTSFPNCFDKIIYLNTAKKTIRRRATNRLKNISEKININKSFKIRKHFEKAWYSYIKEYPPKKFASLIINIKVIKT